MDKISPKMVVLNIGINNLLHGTSAKETVQGIQMIVDRLRGLYPDAFVLVMELFPTESTRKHHREAPVAKANCLLREAYGDGRDSHVKLCSIGDLFLAEDGSIPSEIMPDGLHPSAKGYAIWADAIEPYVIEGLEETLSVLEPITADAHKDLFPKHCKALEERKDYKILMFGDSEVSYWTLNQDPRHTYIWDKYYGSKGAVNLGVGGDIVAGLLWRYNHYPLDGIDPKIIIFEIGVNDLTSFQTPKEEVAFGVRHLVKTVHERWPKAHVVAMACLPFQFKGNPKHSWQEFQAWVDEYNKIFPLYFRDLPYVTTVNICDLYLYPDGTVNTDCMFDSVHPSTIGYELWGERLNPLVEKLLKE